MTTIAIRETLHAYMNAVPEEKLTAIFTVVEADIAHTGINYSAAFRKELDARYEAYKNGTPAYTAEQVSQRIQGLREGRSAKQ